MNIIEDEPVFPECGFPEETGSLLCGYSVQENRFGVSAGRGEKRPRQIQDVRVHFVPPPRTAPEHCICLICAGEVLCQSQQIDCHKKAQKTFNKGRTDGRFSSGIGITRSAVFPFIFRCCCFSAAGNASGGHTGRFWTVLLW